MKRFLRDGKRDKNEEGQGSNVVNGDGKNEGNEDVGDDAGGGGIREEVQGPNLPLKDINLEVLVNSNEEKQNDIKKKNKENEKTQAKDINGIQNTNEESSSGSKKCKYFF